MQMITCDHNGTTFYLCNRKDKLFSPFIKRARKYKDASKIIDEMTDGIFLSFNYPPNVWVSGHYVKNIMIVNV